MYATDYFWFSLFLALNGLILVLLAINVSLVRIKKKISHGDGGDKQLMKAIRTHANGIEQVPIFGLMVLAFSMNGFSSTVLAVFTLAFTLARCAHAAGMLFGIHQARRIGAGVTYLLQCAAALLLLFKVFAACIAGC